MFFDIFYNENLSTNLQATLEYEANNDCANSARVSVIDAFKTILIYS